MWEFRRVYSRSLQGLGQFPRLFGISISQGTNNTTRSAQFIFWDEDEFVPDGRTVGRKVFGNVAVPASTYGVGIIVRECLLLYARIEVEDALGVLTRRLLTECHCLVVWYHGKL